VSTRDIDDERDGSAHRGIGGFLRSLLQGIPWRERTELEETLMLPAPRAGLTIENENGRTHVIGEDRQDIALKIVRAARGETEREAAERASAIQVTTRESGGELVVEVNVPGRFLFRGKADLEVRAPRGTRVSVSSANGLVSLSGLRAAVRAHSSNGPIRVTDIVGDVEVHTSNARVHAECTCGRIVARSSNGKIELAEHKGSVDAATSNGAICCRLESVGAEGVTLATSNGRITLDLPEQVDADVDIRVDNGSIRAQREMPCAPREKEGRLRCTLGRGGAPIKLRASNGSISLK
jgi:HSP20 family molecular chaperone IbpA